MFTSFAKLLCVAALASTAFAQSISIVSPKAGTAFTGGQSIEVELKESAIPSWDSIQEVALVLGFTGSSFDGTHLGSNPQISNFEKQWTDSEGNKYAKISTTAPSNFNGQISLNVAHYYLHGEYAGSQLEYQSVSINVAGSG